MVEVVHDEIDFIAPEGIAEEVCYAIKYAMEVPLPDTGDNDWAPLIADVSYGHSWSERSHSSFDPDNYPRQSFTEWKDIIPSDFDSPLSNPDYVVTW